MYLQAKEAFLFSSLSHTNSKPQANSISSLQKINYIYFCNHYIILHKKSKLLHYIIPNFKFKKLCKKISFLIPIILISSNSFT